MIRTNKGFTLIELMVVIVIIGVLAALAIPKFTNASAKAKMGEGPTVLAAYENAQLAHIAEQSVLGPEADLVFEKPTNSSWFTYTVGLTGSGAAATNGNCVATARKDMGKFLTNSTLTANFATASAAPTHASSDSANAVKLIPNFFR